MWHVRGLPVVSMLTGGRQDRRTGKMNETARWITRVSGTKARGMLGCRGGWGWHRTTFIDNPRLSCVCHADEETVDDASTYQALEERKWPGVPNIPRWRRLGERKVWPVPKSDSNIDIIMWPPGGRLFKRRRARAAGSRSERSFTEISITDTRGGSRYTAHGIA